VTVTGFRDGVIGRFGTKSGIILKNPLITHGISTKSRTRRKEVIEMERKTKILISSVAILAVLSAVAAMAYANSGLNGTHALTTYTYGTTLDSDDIANITDRCGGFFGGMGGMRGMHGRGGGFGEFVTVSQEYKDNVINITESDSDVQALIADGYNVTGIRPIIKATVEGDGTVSLKATTAIVTMSQNTTGRAIVWVDVEQAKVTRIEILSIKIIDKS